MKEKLEVERLRDALFEALEGMEDMIGYVPTYFREKWEHDSYIKSVREALGLKPIKENV